MYRLEPIKENDMRKVYSNFGIQTDHLNLDRNEGILVETKQTRVKMK